MPSGAEQHRDVQHVGNTGLGGNGLSLADFVHRHPAVTVIFGADVPYLDWQHDGCDGWQEDVPNTSALPLGRTQLLHRFESACMRHDFNWKNLHRIEHNVDPSVDSWNQTAKEESDARLFEDLRLVCLIVNTNRTFANPFEDFAEAMAECELRAGRISLLVRGLDLF